VKLDVSLEQRFASPRLALLGAPLVALAACATTTGPTPRATAWPEADLLFQHDAHWVGGDCAYSIELGGERRLWLFGDTWIDASGRHTREGAAMVSNSLGVQSGRDPSRASIKFFWRADSVGKPAAYFADEDGLRFWPGHGARVGDEVVQFLMEVRATNTGLGFEVEGWRAVVIENIDRNPDEWRVTRLETPHNDRRIVIGSGGVLVDGDWLVACGSQEGGAEHDIFAARWKLADVSQHRLDRIEWWSGEALGWRVGADAVRGAEPLFRGGQSEFTVHFDTRAKRYVEIQTRGFGAAELVRRTAPRLTGPWSEPELVFVPPQNAFPNVLIYSGKQHPGLAGADNVLTYCTNSLRFADHFQEAWLYYPRFVRLESAR